MSSNLDKFYCLIAGTRTYNDYEEFSKVTDYMLSQITLPIVIVSGGAKGADSMAEKYAKEKGYELEVFHANWDLYGPALAGMIRNRKMHEFIKKYPHRGCLCFWDGVSKGTADNGKHAKEFSTPIATYNFIQKKLYCK